MGNTVVTDLVPMTRDDFETDKVRHAGRSAFDMLSSTQLEAFDGVHHNVKVFSFSYSKGALPSSTSFVPVSLNTGDFTIDPTKAYIVLHVRRVDSRSALPSSGPIDTIEADDYAWASSAQSALTPRGMTESFSVDTTAVHWRFNFQSPFTFHGELFVLNGKSAPPIAAALAVAQAFALEQRIVADTFFAERLFYNAATSSCAGAHAPISFEKARGPKICDTPVLTLLRRNALLRSLLDIRDLPSLSQHQVASVESLETMKPLPKENDTKPVYQHIPPALPALALGQATKERKEIQVSQLVLPKHEETPADDEAAHPSQDADAADVDEQDREIRLKQQTPIASEILPYLFVGGEVPSRDKKQLLEKRITHVINAAAIALPNPFPELFEYTSLFLTDSPEEDIPSLFPYVIGIIETTRQNGGKVYVHCHQGVSRSCTLVICYVMWLKGMTYDEAYRFVRERRTIASPNAGFLVRLLQWEKHLIEKVPRGLWHFVPYSSEFHLPFTWKHNTQERGKVFLDPRTCHALVLKKDSNPVVYYYKGEQADDELSEAATLQLELFLKCNFYTGEERVALSRNARVTFQPQFFCDCEVAELEADSQLELVREAADCKNVDIAESPSVDSVLSAFGNFSEYAEGARLVAEGERRRRRYREELFANPEIEVNTKLDDKPAQQEKDKEEDEACEGNALGFMTIFAYPFDSEPLDLLDLSEFDPTTSYAVVVQGTTSHPAMVHIWIGEQCELDEDDEIGAEYDQVFTKRCFTVGGTLVKNVPSIYEYQGQESEPFMRLF